MDAKKKLIADLLFWVQVVGMLVVCLSQFFRLLETTQGQLLSMFLTTEAYFCLHLLLAIGAHRAQPSRATRQAMWTYVLWSALFVCCLYACGFHPEYRWSQNDTRTILLVTMGTVVLMVCARVRGFGWRDPAFRSFLAMLCKSVPQFMVAFEISRRGAAGVPLAAIIAGNATILVRIGQIGFTIREAGWDRHRVWLCASEVMNEVSWATVSVVWIYSS